ncbi:MAG: redoxin domain-containing protein [Candidatus Glassbacteria bacterium]|nr:redoxin domain-containing protein [Candidatus Glassbacteria bacterium]
MYKDYIVILTAAVLTAADCSPSQGFPIQGGGAVRSTASSRPAAVEFPEYAGWLNTDRPYRLSDFRGKLVLLDFWTYCCINCMHVLPDLKKLERKYPELVVIGVHSAKFTGEQDLENIREAVVRYDIEHPVINDYRFELWRSYGIRAWPSFVLIDPAGRVAGSANGEGLYSLFDQYIAGLIDEFEPQGLLKRERFEFNLAKFGESRSLLSYPGKLEADEEGGRLFISDSNNDRILVVDTEGRILEVIGSGIEGNEDGSFEEAKFFRPQGMAYDPAAGVLYIADTENHTVRKADLASRTVTTILGTGVQGRGILQAGTGTEVALNSPWDLLLEAGELRIAMAGPHQLWTMNTATYRPEVFAGTGREDLLDGPALQAQLAQPSGLASGGRAVYFADSETSSVRKVEDGRVKTLVGSGIFDFGDVDGDFRQARLQHPLGVFWHGGLLYVADTYNNKVKVLDPAGRKVATLIGTGESGRRDGPAGEATLNEPNGLVFLRGKLYIADTNNSLVRVYDPGRDSVGTLGLSGLEKLSRGEFPNARKVMLPGKRVSPEVRELEVSVEPGRGLEINREAPNRLEVSSSDLAVARILPFTDPSGDFKVKVPLDLSEGETTLKVELEVYYCETDWKSLCFVEQVVFELPLVVTGSGDRSLQILHRLKM